MLCFMNLITDKAGTDLLRSKGETSRDVWMDLELTDCSGMIFEVILYHTRVAWLSRGEAE